MLHQQQRTVGMRAGNGSGAFISTVRTRRRVLILATAATALATRPGTVRLGQKKNLVAYERQILEALETAQGRGARGLDEEQVAQIQAAVEVLEADGGLSNPTLDSELDGKWRLLYTTRPGTASPIQRAFTGVDSFSVFQEVSLQGEEPRVNNIVEFGSTGYLKVEAQASTDSQPLEGFTPRQGDDNFLFGLFGRSMSYPPARRNMRIDFQFDRAAFHFSFLPFTVPYPVPFRILGDERKGWVDVTYVSQDRSFRLTRGNKGTLFVLVKDVPLKQRLLAAIRRKDPEDQIQDLVDQLVETNPTPAPARSPLAGGTWRLVYTQQAAAASALQKFGTSQANTFQIIDVEAGTVRNRVDLAGGLVRISARGEIEAAPGQSNRTNVYVQEAGVVLGEDRLSKPLVLPLPAGRNEGGRGNPGYVDWLYLDEDLRVTRGSKGSLFVHTREADDA